ncbi:hypothetical protein M569_17590 [Genlisea aurea]|uniref:Uncharacterized protein n=1 Tax=Genlisea aurea TaxID=192259 RepID=S8BRH2_9LAMI|nr:hypothetical protein M569_17590 [Genlisea aurea]
MAPTSRRFFPGPIYFQLRTGQLLKDIWEALHLEICVGVSCVSRAGMATSVAQVGLPTISLGRPCLAALGIAFE